MVLFFEPEGIRAFEQNGKYRTGCTTGKYLYLPPLSGRGADVRGNHRI